MKKHFFQEINGQSLNLSRIPSVSRVFILQSHHLCTGKYNWKQKFIFLHIWLDQLLTRHFKHLYLKYLVKMPFWTKHQHPLQKRHKRQTPEGFRDKSKSKFTCDRLTRSTFYGLQKLSNFFQHRELRRGRLSIRLRPKHSLPTYLTSLKF